MNISGTYKRLNHIIKECNKALDKDISQTAMYNLRHLTYLCKRAKLNLYRYKKIDQELTKNIRAFTRQYNI